MRRRWFPLCLLLVVGGAMLADNAPILVIYHEADCPSVDPTRMKRMKRIAAEHMGLVPAADCHPEARVRYLGVGPAGFTSLQSDESAPKTVHVKGYTTRNGTVVEDYSRRPPRP